MATAQTVFEEEQWTAVTSPEVASPEITGSCITGSYRKCWTENDISNIPTNIQISRQISSIQSSSSSNTHLPQSSSNSSSHTHLSQSSSSSSSSSNSSWCCCSGFLIMSSHWSIWIVAMNSIFLVGKFEFLLEIWMLAGRLLMSFPVTTSGHFLVMQLPVTSLLLLKYGLSCAHILLTYIYCL